MRTEKRALNLAFGILEKTVSVEAQKLKPNFSESK